MPHYPSIDKISLQDAWLTIGVFDGVHRGHQALLRQLVSGAHADPAASSRGQAGSGCPAVVMTFHPHPAVILGGKADFKCLTTPEERARLLESLGVDIVITQTFNRRLASQTAEEFMRRVSKSLGLRHLLVGHDAALGRGRAGNASRLAEIGKELGYTVQVIPPLTDGGGILSSTRIRAAVAAGEVAAAAADLGRYYSVSGPVIHGDGRGRGMNMPTANLTVPLGKITPANGVYACWAWLDDKKFAAVTNIGIRPTFESGEPTPTVETHLLDFDGDLYDRIVKLEFVDRLRQERKFPSVEALLEQIRADIARAGEILNGSPPK